MVQILFLFAAMRKPYCVSSGNAVLKRVGDEFLEVRPYFTGNFYALQSYSPSSDKWCEWQIDRPDLKAGVVMLFRRQKSSAAVLKLSLHGLDDTASYDVEVRMGFDKSPIQTMSGQKLSEMKITISDKPGSALVFYKEK